MSTLDDLISDVVRRADEDPACLSGLSTAERPAYIAGLAERAWRRVALVAVGFVIGVCVIAIGGCGGGGTDADGKPDVGIDPPNCAASGACT